MNEQIQKADICIVGAGVAGAALACTLANSGKQVCVIEKDWRAPDRIVGELMQPDGIEQLQQMGLKHLLDGYDAQDIIGYAIIKNNVPLHINYPNAKTGKGMHNGKFIQKMRDEFSTAKNIQCIEAEAQDFLRNTDESIGGVLCLDKNGNTYQVHAKLTIVADGIFSSFRKQMVAAKEENTGYFLGFLLRDCPLPFAQRGHVFLTEGSPFLCYPVSSTEIRFLIDFPKGQVPKKGEELMQFLNTQVRSRLPETMHTAFDTCMREAKFKVMPNHYLPAKPNQTDGAIVLGDALNMRHPLTGGGMTVCLRDVHTLSHLLKTTGFDTPQERSILAKSFYNSRTQNTVINVLADALYKVMSHSELKDACYDYLSQGGKQANEPIALLSGLNKERTTLAKHFFAVAAQKGWEKTSTNRTLGSIKDAYNMFSDAYNIIHPLLKNELSNKAAQTGLDTAEFLFKRKAL